MSHLLIFHEDLKTCLPSANIISEISYVKLQNYYMIKGQKDKQAILGKAVGIREDVIHRRLYIPK